MKLLATNDLHFARRNPSSRIDSYNDELFASLDQIFKLARLTHCGAILIAGDIFHDKGQALWSVLIRLLEWGQQVRQTMELLTIMGNHDETHDRFESMENTPYGALVGSGIFIDVSRRAHKIGTAGPTVYGIPWPDGSKPDAFRDLPPEVDLVMAHGFATPEGQERWGVYCHKYDELARMAPHVKVWHFGHDHTDHGVFRLKNRAQVVNVGALARGALDYDAILREVKVALIDIEGDVEPTVQQVALKVPPAEQIFDLELHKQKAAELSQLERFLEELSTGLSGVLDVDYHAVLQAMTLPDDVRAKVREYISRAEAVAV